MLTYPIETVIFDLDGTLRHNVPSADDFQYNFVRQLKIPGEPHQQKKGTLWAHRYWAQSSDFLADIKKYGKMGESFWVQYAYRYLRSLDVPPDQAKRFAPELFQSMQLDFKPDNQVDPYVEETLQGIRDTGLFLGLVSNRSTPCQEECEHLGLLHYFDFAYVAAEVDAWKPDPQIFDRALEITGSPPERTIYIGDNYYTDVVGAQKAGLQAILLDPQDVFLDANLPQNYTVIRSIEEIGALLI